MYDGIDTGLVALLITWVTPLVGCIPVLIGWVRITSRWNGKGQRTFPKALCALTASICIDPVGIFVVGFIQHLLADRFLSLVNVLPRFWITFLAIGFILNMAALLIAVGERNVARTAVLTGSSAVAAVNIVGFAWLLSTSRGISMWTS
jgi:hypothetical protein